MARKLSISEVTADSFRGLRPSTYLVGGGWSSDDAHWHVLIWQVAVVMYPTRKGATYDDIYGKSDAGRARFLLRCGMLATKVAEFLPGWDCVIPSTLEESRIIPGTYLPTA